MKKQLVILGIVALLVCIGLSGCESTNTAEAKILGKWQVTNTTELQTLNFLENGSFSLIIKENITWGFYAITEKTLVLNINGRNASYEYSLSNNNQKITLTSLKNKSISVVFIRSKSE